MRINAGNVTRSHNSTVTAYTFHAHYDSGFKGGES